MKKAIVFIIVVVLASAANAMSSAIGDVRWNQSNIQMLHSFDKAAVVNFANELSGNSVAPMTEKELLEYKWVDLAGDGKYELATTTSSGPCCVFLSIYWQRSSGSVELEVVGGNAGKLSKTVRDLNGDGKDELIIWKDVAAPGSWAPSITTPRWPAVYRLENGKFVEDSRNFADFYDTEILPQLTQDEKAFEARRGRQDVGTLLERDKILRVLGRDPTAGLQQAYQWMNSGDPQRIQGAMAIFADIGGHEDELRSALAALKTAFERERAAHRATDL